jgi:hypothetical protein
MQQRRRKYQHDAQQAKQRLSQDQNVQNDLFRKYSTILGDSPNQVKRRTNKD